MARKPARMYRDIKQRSCTRREYMGGIPGSKIVTYEMGNKKANFPVTISLLSKEACQIRHNAIEAARITSNKYLIKYVGQANYHMKLKIFPHEVLRENKQATGAGADRVSQGMRQAYGKIVSTAARVRENQTLITISTTPANFKYVKKALSSAGQKFPTPVRIVIEKGEELIQN